MSASTHNEHRAWLSFRGTDIQREFHASLKSEIDRVHLELEQAPLERVTHLQAEAKVWRRVLAYIHQHDTPQIAATYGP